MSDFQQDIYSNIALIMTATELFSPWAAAPDAALQQHSSCLNKTFA